VAKTKKEKKKLDKKIKKQKKKVKNLEAKKKMLSLTAKYSHKVSLGKKAQKESVNVHALVNGWKKPKCKPKAGKR